MGQKYIVPDRSKSIVNQSENRKIINKTMYIIGGTLLTFIVTAGTLTYLHNNRMKNLNIQAEGIMKEAKMTAPRIKDETVHVLKDYGFSSELMTAVLQLARKTGNSVEKVVDILEHNKDYICADPVLYYDQKGENREKLAAEVKALDGDAKALRYRDANAINAFNDADTLAVLGKELVNKK